MVAHEPARHRLYDRLVEVLGDQDATTLMSYLPAIESSAIATKADVQALGDRLEERLGERIGQVEDRMGRLEDRMNLLDDRLHRATTTFVATSIGSMATLGALAFAAASLI
ncbi:MAG: hypothetical protein M3N51_03510 [Actinomycetota bacterium]|nr:hypothetical protein [Actinomycetota bacterium]